MKRNPGCIESESQVCGKAVQSSYTSQPISLDIRQVQLLCPCNPPNYKISVLPQEKVLASKMQNTIQFDKNAKHRKTNSSSDSFGYFMCLYVSFWRDITLLLNGVNYICSFLVISSYAEVICVFTSDFEESGKHMFSDPEKSSRSCKAIGFFFRRKSSDTAFFQFLQPEQTESRTDTAKAQLALTAAD